MMRGSCVFVVRACFYICGVFDADVCQVTVSWRFYDVVQYRYYFAEGVYCVVGVEVFEVAHRGFAG